MAIAADSVSASCADSGPAFYQMLDAMPQMAWLCWANGQAEYFNQQAVAAFGGAIAPLLAEGWHSRVHPADLPQTLTQWREAICTGNLYEIEHRLQMVDGTYRWHLTRATPQRNPAGQIIRWFFICTNINDRVEMEQALRASEERFRLAARAVVGLVYDWDLQTHSVYRSEGLYALIGLHPDHVPSTRDWWSERVHPGDLDKLRARMQDILLGGSDRYDAEYRIRHEDGHWVEVWDRGYLIRDAEQNVIRVVGSTSDITHRKQAEKSQRLLAEASAVLVSSLDSHTILSKIAQLVVPLLADVCYIDIKALDGKIQRVAWQHHDPVQPAWHDHIQDYVPQPNWTTDPVVMVLEKGKSLLIPQITGEWLQTIARSAEHFQFLCQIQLESLMIVPLRARNRTLGALTLARLSPTCQPYHFADLALAEELVQRVALALDNAQLYQQAQETNRIKDEFLAVLSHELRSPLNPILGWSQLLRTRKLDPATTERALETIERNAKLQTQLIEDLLDVSRILQGKMILKIEPVNLGAIVAAALETVGLAAAAKNISIETVCSPELETISADANRLQQIFWNLLSNAIKFTSPGGCVTVAITQIASEIQIQVKDTGKGIHPDFLPYVFDYFRQEDSKTTRQFGGLGLGLAIVRYFTELHGGRVQAESPGEGQGATFTIHLPLLSAPAQHRVSDFPQSDRTLY